jgi:hypothetical protein
MRALPHTILRSFLQNRKRLTMASTTRIVAPVAPPMTANRRGPNPVSNISWGIPPSGRVWEKGTVRVRVVEIAAMAPMATVITWPDRFPTTRNMDPRARSGMLSTAPNRKNVRYTGPVHPYVTPMNRHHVATANRLMPAP